MSSSPSPSSSSSSSSLLSTFVSSFSIDTSEQPIYLATRYRVGSLFATVAALYNTFLLRQQIIRNSISITRSNNPTLVKTVCVGVGALYFMGLYAVWHLPSFFSEVAVRVYVATQDTVTNALLQSYMQQIMRNNTKISKALQKDGLKL